MRAVGVEGSDFMAIRATVIQLVDAPPGEKDTTYTAKTGACSWTLKLRTVSLVE